MSQPPEAIIPKVTEMPLRARNMLLMEALWEVAGENPERWLLEEIASLSREIYWVDSREFDRENTE